MREELKGSTIAEYFWFCTTELEIKNTEMGVCMPSWSGEGTSGCCTKEEVGIKKVYDDNNKRLKLPKLCSKRRPTNVLGGTSDGAGREAWGKWRSERGTWKEKGREVDWTLIGHFRWCCAED